MLQYLKVGNDECSEINKPVSPIESSKLGMKNFSGVFLVLGVMIAFGLLVLIIEILISSWQESKEKGVSLRYINSCTYIHGNTLAILIQLRTFITGIETLKNGCNAGDLKLCPVHCISISFKNSCMNCSLFRMV